MSVDGLIKFALIETCLFLKKQCNFQNFPFRLHQLLARGKIIEKHLEFLENRSSKKNQLLYKVMITHFIFEKLTSFC